MTVENFEKVLRALLQRRPFKPFTIEMHTGERIEIDYPEATVLRQGVAVFMALGPVPVYFDHLSVNKFIDSPAHSLPPTNLE